MLSNFSQYSPQGLVQPLFGVQGVGSPHLGPGFFGQVPYGQAPYGQGGPFAMNPYLLHPGANGAYAGMHNPALQIIPVLGQLAQHIALPSGVTQQIGIALNQLAQQLAALCQQIQAGSGFGASQGFGSFAGNPFTSAVGSFTGQSPLWGAQRAQTIQ
jgi:hypothetical protein